jgi:oxygen-dependent protoporphyrinogen oxidase
MHELVDTLAQRLPDGSVRLDCAAKQLKLGPNGKSWEVTTGDNNVIDADAVVLATPAFGAGDLLSSIDSNAAAELQSISYASTATVSLAYRRADFPQAPNSFGFVVPAIERRKIMACTFSSLKYPGRAPEDCTLMRAFVGGSLQPELFAASDGEMESSVRGELASLLGVSATPIFSRIWRHANSMPQYHVGHEARVQRIEAALQQFPTLTLAGSAYHGVGISDCVRTGEEAAEQVFARILSTS